MNPDEQENLILKQEIELLDDDKIIAIVRNEGEEDIIRLQLAWEILDKRGLKDAVLSKIEQEDEAKKLSIDDLLNPENEEKFSDTTFADKIGFVVGSEIKANHQDVLGIYRGSLAKEIDIDTRTISLEEKEIQIKKLRVRLIISAASFVTLLLVYAITDSFKGKLIIEWGLTVHIIMTLAFAFYNYISYKNEN